MSDHNQALAAFFAPPAQDIASPAGARARKKTVFVSAFSFGRLISSFHSVAVPLLLFGMRREL